ncbi:MAG: urea ABC transporter ATP-binding subunit UrtE [Verrucomicrobiota bacterium]|jgi:urea transport system ATP-binding protein|nr:urea ABC transporter ATP-binding subunit UrtE [Verrucomicrobiota bacterium]|tara:strand:+ start:3644 stop:4339 length:696 start_codon:yes stop_codon:yes gene_type:complete
MLSLSHISFSYGLVQILDDVSIEVPKAKVVCVMGRNGVGKTTLMRNIVGLEKASKGSVTLDGRDISKVPARRRAQSGLALVPQGRMIFPRLSVKENLEVGLSARTDGRRTIPEEIYELFPVLKEMGARQGGNLSGGQQQQLAIGRALVGEPRVLLLDEPTEGIQPNIIQAIGQVLRRLVKEKEMTVVLVEQYVDFIKEFGDHFYIMNRGRVVANGDTPQLSEAIVRQHLSV